MPRTNIPDQVGIESINIYGCSLSLDQQELAIARGRDPQQVVNDFLIDTRALNPLFEDVITMAVNAAYPLMKAHDPTTIGLLAVGTEGSLDFGKPISTNIHSALSLGPHVRNFETKHACYSGVAALQTALDWVASGSAGNQCALVISSDFSRIHLNMREEFVLGGVASAAVISANPKVIAYEREKRGVWTADVYDTFRPTSRHEIGNNEVSLYSYLDALEGSFLHYCQSADTQIEYATYFPHMVFHTPFPGMAFQAHRTLYNLRQSHSKTEVKEDFESRVLPTLHYAQKLGSTYGASNFVGLCGLLAHTPIDPDTRIGFFAYGSGSIGEFYSGRICPEAAATVATMDIDTHLSSRQPVTVEEYEHIEQEREKLVEIADFKPSFDYPANLWRNHYEGKKRYILTEVKNFQRHYEWS